MVAEVIQASAAGNRSRLGLMAVCTLLTVSTLLGGASRETPLRVMIIELASLGVLWRLAHGRLSWSLFRKHGLEAVLWAAIIGTPLLQLVPLPPAIWTSLPGRSLAQQALAAAQLPLGWLPLSLTPMETMSSALALAPPLAMYVAASNLNSRDTQFVFIVYLAFASVGLLIGSAQMFFDSGPMYFYSDQSPRSLDGFMENRNHEATVLLCCLPMAAALSVSPTRLSRNNAISIMVLAFSGIALIGIGIVRSRAGLVLAVPTLVASVAIIWRGGHGSNRLATVVSMVSGVAVAVVAVSLFALRPILNHFNGDIANWGRQLFWPHVVRAAEAFSPVGSGIGSFERVYASVEPLALVSPHDLHFAHNEYLQIWLEAGWIGLICLLGFFAWFAFRAVAVWRIPAELEGGLHQASATVVVILLVHSTVDYPLRTLALSSLLGFCCGVLVQGRGRSGDHVETARRPFAA